MPIALYSASGSEPVAFSVESPVLSIEALKWDVVSHIGIPPEKRSGLLLGRESCTQHVGRIEGGAMGAGNAKLASPSFRHTATR